MIVLAAHSLVQGRLGPNTQHVYVNYPSRGFDSVITLFNPN